MPCCAPAAGFLRTSPTGRFLALAFWRCAAAKGRAAAGRSPDGPAPDPMRAVAADAVGENLAEDTDQEDALAEELAEIDAVLARSSRLLAGENLTPRAASGPDVDTAGQGAKAPETALPDSLGPLIRDLDWDEDQRLADWLAVVDQLRGENMPAVLAAAIAWEAWQDIEPLQHQHWLGPLLVAALLRERGKVGSHLFCLNAGLRIVPRGSAQKPGPNHPAAGRPRRLCRGRRRSG